MNALTRWNPFKDLDELESPLSTFFVRAPLDLSYGSRGILKGNDHRCTQARFAVEPFRDLPIVDGRRQCSVQVGILLPPGRCERDQRGVGDVVWIQKILDGVRDFRAAAAA